MLRVWGRGLRVCKKLMRQLPWFTQHCIRWSSEVVRLSCSEEVDRADKGIKSLVLCQRSLQAHHVHRSCLEHMFLAGWLPWLVFRV